MRILIAPDSFKESLTAAEAASFMAAGVGRIFPEAEVIQMPLSDGGEGLVDNLASAMNGKILQQEVCGPMQNRVNARFAVVGEHTAIIEMAQASGLGLVPAAARNPLYATSYGTGELIRAALDRGCTRLIIGIGGSATNDGGAGMAQALGIKFLNIRSEEIGPGAAGLLELAAIDTGGIDPRLARTSIEAACDVSNPLFGPQGAARIYGPQKGAAAADIDKLDQALVRLGQVIKHDLGLEVSDVPGAGAAGGMGAGLMAFAGAALRSGLELVFDLLQFETQLAEGLDLIITGEGEINSQSLYGKVPVGVARLARKYNIPVLAIVGNIGPGADQVYAQGITSIMSIAPGPISREDSMARAGELMADAAERAMRLLKDFMLPG